MSIRQNRLKYSTKEEIIAILKKNKDYLKKYKVKNIGLFGSYIRGEQKKSSDVDILVEFLDIIDFFDFLELEEYLSNIIGTKVDLVMKTALKKDIGRYILKEVIYV